MKKYLYLSLLVFLIFTGCKKQKFTVRFMVDNNLYSEQNVLNGTKLKPFENPKKEGFTFECWMLEEKAFSFDALITKDLVLNARFTKLKEIVSIKFNNGGVLGDEEKKLEKGSILILPIPEAKGYEFLGWFYDEAFTKRVNDNTKFTKDAVLYSKWIKVFEIEVFKHFGDCTKLFIKEGNVLGKIDISNIEGKEFEKWIIDDDMDSEINPETYIPTKNACLKAVWKNYYEVITNPETGFNYFSLTNYGKTKNFKEITIPSQFDGKEINGIARLAFAGDAVLESIVIPEGVKYLQDYAFKGCDKLKKITFPKEIKYISYLTIEDTALFKSASLPFIINDILIKGLDTEEMVIPNEIKVLAPLSFSGFTNLKKVKLNNVRKIQKEAFLNASSLEKLTTTKLVFEIESNAFLNTKFYDSNDKVFLGKTLVKLKTTNTQESVSARALASGFLKSTSLLKLTISSDSDLLLIENALFTKTILKDFLVEIKLSKENVKTHKGFNPHNYQFTFI